MSKACDCSACPAYGEFCEGCSGQCAYRDCAGGCAACPIRCTRRSDLDAWLEAIGGLALDQPLASQPRFDLPPFFPQLLNQVEIPSMIAREPAVAVGIAKVLTPNGRVSRRAIHLPYATYSLRTQWGIGENSLLLCAGTYLDDYLEKLWAAQARGENLWGRVQTLGFDAATSLNFSIYFDQPRLEHLINLKRSWLTVQHMQQSRTLIAIPHLQWCQPLDMERQLAYARAQGLHTLALNLQMVKRCAWDPIEAGLQAIRRQSPELRLLFLGVVALKRMAHLTALFPTASFTNTAVHYLAGRHVQLVRAPGHPTRLIKEPVDGHPDIILAENVRLYREFLAEPGR